MIDRLRKLKQLPPELHWFCCRDGPDDDSVCYVEDVVHGKTPMTETETKRLERAVQPVHERKSLVIDALTIFAFDGDDAVPYQDWLKNALDDQLTQCDICIREFHRGRRELKQRLEL